MTVMSTAADSVAAGRGPTSPVESAPPALPRGADPWALTRDLDLARELFLTGGAEALSPHLRALVLDSWQRSVASGVDPEELARIGLDEELLREVRAAHPLTSVMPVIRRLLVDSATDAGLLVAVSDAAGQLLYVEGAHDLRSRAEHMHFMPGADWSEASAGTNAPGTALALGRPVQILGPEHLSSRVTPWSCSAAPIRDPDNGAMLGVLDVTGGPDVVSATALSLVRATAAAAEAELRIARLTPRSSSPRVSVAASTRHKPKLSVLGVQSAVFDSADLTSRLSLRHSEIVLLMHLSTTGLTADQLAVSLSDDDQALVTVRAEISRLRPLLGPIEIKSRPYRLSGVITSDVETVRKSLRDDRLRRAVAAYAGPVLPMSVAPKIVELRDDLHSRLRSALLASTDADPVLAFADTPHGHDDYEIWSHALDVLPGGSPRLAQVQEHVAKLDAELG